MRWNQKLIIAFAISLIFIIGKEAFADKTLHDDFSIGTTIDPDKWVFTELVREVTGGKLIFKLGNNPYTFRDQLLAVVRHADPSMINTIQCDVTLNNIVSGNFAGAHISGRFYNADGTGGTTGDIRAVLNISDRNGDLAARWQIDELLDGSWDRVSDGVLLDPITLGTTYTLRITYDGNNGFEFYISGVTTQATGPARLGAAGDPAKTLGTVIFSDVGSVSEYISAEFDDFYIDDGGGLALYDNFSTAPLDQTKWINLEVAREVSNQELRLNVQGVDSWGSIYAIPARESTTPYFETTALVESGSQVSPGIIGIARIGGNYYNENRGPGSPQDYNEYEGNVYAYSGLFLNDSGGLFAGCAAMRLDKDGYFTTPVFEYTFPVAILFDTQYTLSVEFTGTSIIFKCDNETYRHDIKTSTYPPYGGQSRHLLSRVGAEVNESGYMMERFDDVYTGYMTPPNYDLSGVWYYLETSVDNDCNSSDQPASGKVTVKQSGSDVTMTDEEGTVFTGVINGSYVRFFGESQGGGQTQYVNVAVIMSSAASGYGYTTITRINDVEVCRINRYYTFSNQPISSGDAGGGGGGGGGCFIATAAYGSRMAKEIKILKNFRDNVLLKNAVGTALVEAYYRVSPPAADFVAQHDNVRMLVRWGLLPIVGVSWIALTLGLAPMAAFLILLLSCAVWIFVFSKKKKQYPTL